MALSTSDRLPGPLLGAFAAGTAGANGAAVATDGVSPPATGGRASGFLAFLSALPLLSLIGPGAGICRSRPRDIYRHQRPRRHILPQVQIHSLLLSGRRESVAAHLHARRRHEQEPPARINRRNLQCRRIPRI